jgi:hypothetical protein
VALEVACQHLMVSGLFASLGSLLKSWLFFLFFFLLDSYFLSFFIPLKGKKDFVRTIVGNNNKQKCGSYFCKETNDKNHKISHLFQRNLDLMQVTELDHGLILD